MFSLGPTAQIKGIYFQQSPINRFSGMLSSVNPSIVLGSRRTETQNWIFHANHRGTKNTYQEFEREKIMNLFLLIFKGASSSAFFSGAGSSAFSSSLASSSAGGFLVSFLSFWLFLLLFCRCFFHSFLTGFSQPWVLQRQGFPQL